MNPVYELLVEAMDCADRLALGDGAALLHDAIERAYEVVELPEWLPQFAALVKAMDARRETVPSELQFSTADYS